MLLNTLSALPAERIAAVETALLQTFNTTHVAQLTLLAGGLSGSAVYKLVVGEGAYTLKLNPPIADHKPANDILTLAAAAGVAPKLYYHNAEQGITISSFIAALPLRGSIDAGKLVIRLAQTVKAIHEIPFTNPGANLFDTIDGLIHHFKNSKQLAGPVFDECFDHYETIKRKYPRSNNDLVLSHNDLNPNNILFDGQHIWVIDWDAASLNNRYIDLANLANFFVHTDEHEDAFLHTYFGTDADEHQKACFFVMRQLCRIVYGMLMFRIVFQAKPVGFEHDQQMDGIDMKAFGDMMAQGKLSLAAYEGQFMYGKALINTAVAQMRMPRFAHALAGF